MRLIFSELHNHGKDNESPLRSTFDTSFRLDEASSYAAVTPLSPGVAVASTRPDATRQTVEPARMRCLHPNAAVSISEFFLASVMVSASYELLKTITGLNQAVNPMVIARGFGGFKFLGKEIEKGCERRFAKKHSLSVWVWGLAGAIQNSISSKYCECAWCFRHIQKLDPGFNCTRLRDGGLQSGW